MEIGTRKTLGQHWLKDDTTLQAICKAAHVQQGDTVLEIGPGPGALTKLLTQQSDSVVAVELDDRLAQGLLERVSADNLKVIQGDILRFDLTSLPIGYKVVANIPYYLTSNLIRVLSESINPPKAAVLLVQKEVAERVAAQPGDMSLLSVTAQFYWEVSTGRVVGAELFTPPPKVDSQILILKRRSEALFPDTDPKKFFRLVKAGFASRRKTLLNSLSGGLRISKAETGELLKEARVDPGLRPQSLSLPGWHDVYQVAMKRKVL